MDKSFLIIAFSGLLIGAAIFFIAFTINICEIDIMKYTTKEGRQLLRLQRMAKKKEMEQEAKREARKIKALYEDGGNDEQNM